MKMFLLSLAVMLCLAAFVSAQDVKPIDIYIGGGLSLPNSPDFFKDYWKTGYHGLAGVGFKAFPGFSLVGMAEYHSFPIDAEGVDGGSFNFFLFTVNGRLALDIPAAPIKPYFLGGIGLANSKISDITEGDETFKFIGSETDLCFNVGAGLEFKAGPAAAIFIQGRYVYINTEGDALTYIPITLGVKF
ncbi:MAG: outer membrane beta-barrel protein [candidate division Zixibacteria bacterium]|nr:outer membrane beta-barrel protein [candidate division Zixibacteria bacterium]